MNGLPGGAYILYPSFNDFGVALEGKLFYLNHYQVIQGVKLEDVAWDHVYF